MVGDSERERRQPPRSRRAGPARLTVVCLPGAGGPELAEQLRRFLDTPGAAAVRLVVTVPVLEAVPVLIGDPLSGMFWPFSYPARDEVTARREAERRAQQLWWLAWEMGVDAEVELCEGSPLGALQGLLRDGGSDAVLVAGSTARRWHGIVRELRSEARRGGVSLAVVLDTPVRPLRGAALAATR